MIYRALLRLYPSEFYRKFVEELDADFIESTEDARASGRPLALLECWAAALSDLALSVPREWLRTPWPPVLVLAAGIAGGIFYYVVGRIYRVRSFASDTQPPESPELLMLMGVMALIPTAAMLLLLITSRFVSSRRRGVRRHV